MADIRSVDTMDTGEGLPFSEVESGIDAGSVVNGLLPAPLPLSARSVSSDQDEFRIVVVDKQLQDYLPLINAIRCLGARVVLAEPDLTQPVDKDDDTVYVTDCFEGDAFECLYHAGCRIVASPAIIKCALNNEALPFKSRPLYCTMMDKLVLCFAGFKVKEDLSHLADLVHRMGGSIRKEFTSKVTHLVAVSTSGEKYRTAVSLGTCIMAVEWVHKCWEHRADHGIMATDEHLEGHPAVKTQLQQSSSGRKCLNLCENMDINRLDDKKMKYKLSPFSFSVLSFQGFCEEDRQHMEDVAIANGGQVCEAADSLTCTHLVVNERGVKAAAVAALAPSDERSARLHVVKSEFVITPADWDKKRIGLQSRIPQWFWASIQMDACADESMYTVDEGAGGGDKTPGSRDSIDTASSAAGALRRTPKTLSGSKSHRRKRLRENLAQLACGGEGGEAGGSQAPPVKRRSSVEGEGGQRRSLSTSFLDATVDTSAPLSDITVRDNMAVSPTQPQKEVKLTPRQQTILELYSTEKNYVHILQTIVQVFRDEIERVDQPGGPILDAREIREIFGGIPPLLDIHTKIRAELGELTAGWAAASPSDGQMVGAVFLKHKEGLARFYPHFINYFEKTKEVIAQCDRLRPRFHAFLRLCQSRPECGRQSLTELLIRPVQRLPSVMLLLKDIRRRTDKGHQDHDQLDQAISALEEVMTHINEDKRKAEGHQTMFEIVNDIENCPPSLLSAHRSFVRKVDAVEVTSELSGKGDPITLFVFSDTLEICKRRSRAGLNAKSPGGAMHHRGVGGPKPYRHLSLLPLSTIKRVVDICEKPDCQNVFALVTKRIDDKERLYAFALLSGGADSGLGGLGLGGLGLGPGGEKDSFLTCLSKAVCTSTCRTDYETLLAAVESHVLNIDTTDLNSAKSLSRAATKFSRRISRVFSAGMTPRSMKRAISSVAQLASPLRRDSSVFSLHPSTPLQGLGGAGGGGGGVHTPQGSFDDVSLESDCYSEIVDQMSIGTPSMTRRRETLAGISFSDIQMEIGTPKGGVGGGVEDAGVFATPRPVAPLPRGVGTPSGGGGGGRWFGSGLRRDFSSQSLRTPTSACDLDSLMMPARTSSSSSFKKKKKNKEADA